MICTWWKSKDLIPPIGALRLDPRRVHFLLVEHDRCCSTMRKRIIHNRDTEFYGVP